MTETNQSKQVSIRKDDPVPANVLATVAPEDVTSAELEVLSEIEKNEDNNVKINAVTYQRFGLIVLIFTFGILGVWGGMAPLSGAIVANGFVVAASESKEVQHLKGGIVEKLFVSEGDYVKKGEPILKLNDTQDRAQLDIIKTQYYEIIGNIARLDAQLNERAQVIFPSELNQMANTEQKQRIMDNQIKMFSALTEAHLKKNQILQHTIVQTEKQIEGFKKRVSVDKKHIASFNTEIKERERLYKLKLDSKVRLKEMERDRLEIEGQLYDAQSEISRLSVHIAEIENQIVLENQTYLNQVVSDLQKAQAEQIDLKVRWLALDDTLKRTLIKSPETGIVVGFELDTIGAVLAPGAEICEIVPQDKKFAIKAQVKLNDIDKVYPGQPVDIRFSSFATRFTKVITGNVLRVSADSLEDNQGNFYYEAKVLVDDAGKETIAEYAFDILPGMPVETMLKIGDRTLISYIFKPFTDMLAKAFNEE